MNLVMFFSETEGGKKEMCFIVTFKEYSFSLQQKHKLFWKFLQQFHF